MSGCLVLHRGTRSFAVELEAAVEVAQAGRIHECPGLAEGWRGFVLAGDTLAPVFDPVPGAPGGDLLVSAEHDGFRVAVVADRIERSAARPGGAPSLLDLLAGLAPR